ncbi:hypothetical protein BJ165DRAFT_396341 [Panaeolus papilionaceus]|nr:hypothetical protein BJ165DRAFT_396341 [Panaeolus papilionaceus]
MMKRKLCNGTYVSLPCRLWRDAHVMEILRLCYMKRTDLRFVLVDAAGRIIVSTWLTKAHNSANSDSDFIQFWGVFFFYVASNHADSGAMKGGSRSFHLLLLNWKFRPLTMNRFIFVIRRLLNPTSCLQDVLFLVFTGLRGETCSTLVELNVLQNEF